MIAADAFQQHREFLAAVAPQRVGIATGVAHGVGHCLQHFVADVVPEAVVDLLERIDIHHRDGEIHAAVDGARHRDVAGVGDVAPAVDRGQEVGGDGDLEFAAARLHQGAVPALLQVQRHRHAEHAQREDARDQGVPQPVFADDRAQAFVLGLGVGGGQRGVAFGVAQALLEIGGRGLAFGAGDLIGQLDQPRDRLGEAVGLCALQLQIDDGAYGAQFVLLQFQGREFAAGLLVQRERPGTIATEFQCLCFGFVAQTMQLRILQIVADRADAAAHLFHGVGIAQRAGAAGFFQQDLRGQLGIVVGRQQAAGFLQQLARLLRAPSGGRDVRHVAQQAQSHFRVGVGGGVGQSFLGVAIGLVELPQPLADGGVGQKNVGHQHVLRRIAQLLLRFGQDAGGAVEIAQPRERAPQRDPRADLQVHAAAAVGCGNRRRTGAALAAPVRDHPAGIGFGQRQFGDADVIAFCKRGARRGKFFQHLSRPGQGLHFQRMALVAFRSRKACEREAGQQQACGQSSGGQRTGVRPAMCREGESRKVQSAIQSRQPDILSYEHAV